MQIAIKKSGERIHINEALKTQKYYCPACKNELMQKRGDMRTHHFAHYPSKDEKQNNCPLRYYSGITQWHFDWLNRFNKENIEIILENDNQRFVADVLINNTVIEFQHKNLTIEQFRERNNFYTSLGYKIIWIFDLIDEYQSNKIINDPYYNNENEFQWKRPKKFFRELDVKRENCQIYFQLSDDENVCGLERVVSNTWDFKTFYTDKNRIFSIHEFIDNAYNNIENLYYDPKAKTNKIKTINESKNGKTIPELWNENTKWIIVRNLKNDNVFKLNHNPKPNINLYNRVYGYISKSKYYSNENWYNFYNDSIQIYGWNLPCWEVIKEIHSESSMNQQNEDIKNTDNSIIDSTSNCYPTNDVMNNNVFPIGKTIQQLVEENIHNKFNIIVRCLIDNTLYNLDFFKETIDSEIQVIPYDLNFGSRIRKESSPESSYYKYHDEMVWELL